MDRSFLSQPEVVAASRTMVCVRLATYESASEAQLLASIFRGGSGQLENTVFAILDSDGRTPLVRSGRSPHQFGSASELASTMLAIERGHKQQRWSPGIAGVPRIESVRLALNVAACDHLPLLVTYAPTQQRVRELERAVADTAWSEGVEGRVLFASTARLQEVQQFSRDALEEGYFLVRPDEFGLHGRLVASFSQQTVGLQLAQAAEAYRSHPLAPLDHIRQGHQQGIRWQTQVPVTDPGGRY
jgi:hypothetical protein